MAGGRCAERAIWHAVRDSYVCFVCGFGGLYEPPWNNGAGSDEICPSCGIHFGYDDAAGGDVAAREVVYRERRARWLADGMKWWSSEGPPADWDAEAQLRAVAE
jgi:hypothetical protein